MLSVPTAGARPDNVVGMATIRPAAVAGEFYPADPRELRACVKRRLSAEPSTEISIRPTMLIVPHAGYVYSGPIAAYAYRLLKATTGLARRVVLLGPSHFAVFAGLATPGAEALATPLGLVPVDRELTSTAEAFAVVAPGPAAHAREHSLEVQLPFLQVALGEFTTLALVTGDVAPEAVAEVLDQAIDAPGVIGVISSDLSHYLDYDTARRRDARTAEAITGLRPEDLARDDACGRIAVQAALLLAKRRGWSCRLLALGNSGDTAGSLDRVVGYGAFAVGPEI
ncbi:MAG: AmmeMemoRadiSam system protein B [Acidimicrobiia bacterium]|nr:MAG: AmmeMemoRadiSam system protein B [Acidimicrobiia bacterium]